MYKFLIPLVALAVLLVACSAPQTTTSTTTNSYAASSAPAPVPPPASSMPSSPAPSPSSSSSSAITLLTGKHTVVLKTSKGSITLELDAGRAPKAVTNFVTLAKKGYYDNLTFHRVIPGFMIQGGDPSGNGTGGKSIFGDTFADEIVQPMDYKAGVIAMANRGPDTNGSQFFIMHKDYNLLPLYTIFGHVVSGQDVVDAIASVKTGPGDRPLEPVTFSVQVKS